MKECSEAVGLACCAAFLNLFFMDEEENFGKAVQNVKLR